MSTPDLGLDGCGVARHGSDISAGAKAVGQTAGPGNPGPPSHLSRTPSSPPSSSPGYDKAKADALKITATGSSAAHPVNTALATLGAMQQEGGSPGAARAADELETDRRIRRAPVSEADANAHRIPQSGMVTVGIKD